MYFRLPVQSSGTFICDFDDNTSDYVGITAFRSGQARWFYAQIRCADRTEMMLTVDVADIIAHWGAKVGKIGMHTIYLVSPPHMNRTPYWTMEPLKEIWTAQDIQGRPAYILVTMSNRRYVDAFAGLVEEDLLKRQCVVRIKAQVI